MWHLGWVQNLFGVAWQGEQIMAACFKAFETLLRNSEDWFPKMSVCLQP
jgi:predicted 3-demethylubiquinone-9 3-methyltransferase (glyoxalase superfamily)